MERLFESSLPEEGVHLGQVVVNDTSVLKSFTLKNVSDRELRVHLSSDLDIWIAFQLSNENLLGDQANDDFNQLFNMVNHIEYIDLEPNESADIVISFNPRAPPNTRNGVAGEPPVPGTKFAEVTGTLLIEARCVVSGHDERSGPSSVQQLPFSAHVCHSVLSVEESEKELHFDRCVPDWSYSKGFTIWNRSEVDTGVVFSLPAEFQAEFELVHETTGRKIPHGSAPLQIGGYSNLRVRVNYRPSAVGDFTAQLEVQNTSDEDNEIVVELQASVAAKEQEAGLRITSGNDGKLVKALEFGDCYAGVAKRRVLTLINITQRVLEVHLSAVHAEGDVAFDLYTESDSEDLSPHLSPNHSPNLAPMPNNLISLIEDNRQKQIQRDDAKGHGGVARTRNLSIGGEGDNPASATESMSPLPVTSFDPTPEARSFSPDPLHFGAGLSSRGKHANLASFDDPASFDGPASFDLGDGPMPRRSGRRRVDELVLVPAEPTTVMVIYTPRADVDEDEHEDESNDSDGNRSKSGGDEKEHADNGSARPASLRLSERKFKIRFTATECRQGSQQAQYSQKLKASARVCKSQIALSTTKMNLGDNLLGTQKDFAVEVKNLSDLAASVRVALTSKSIKCPLHFTIPPRRTHMFRLVYTARQVNPGYRKQITFCNQNNRHNELVLKVTSNNVAHEQFHSLFYTITTGGKASSSPNTINFGTLVVNKPSVRTFSIKNITSERLRLLLRAQEPFSKEIRLFLLPKQEADAQQQQQQQADKPASDGSQQSASGEADNSSSSINELVRRLVLREEREELMESSFLNHESEREYVLDEVARFGQLQKAVESGQLVPLSLLELAPREDRLVLVVYTLGQVPKDWIPHQLRNLEAALTVQFVNDEKSSPRDSLVDFGRASVTSTAGEPSDWLNSPLSISSITRSKSHDNISRSKSHDNLAANTNSNGSGGGGGGGGGSSGARAWPVASTLKADPANNDKAVPSNSTISLAVAVPHTYAAETLLPDLHTPMRELQLLAKVCVSEMDLDQTRINFGTLTKIDTYQRTLVINNPSHVPLLYVIKKKGSIASQDVSFPHSDLGVVRPQGHREVPFVFKPSMKGEYRETFTIENVWNPANTCTVTVKATMQRSAKFEIDRRGVDFGVMLRDDSQDATTATAAEAAKTDGASPAPQRVELRNISSKARTFKVKLAKAEHILWCPRTPPPLPPSLSAARIRFRLKRAREGGAADEVQLQEEEEHLTKKLKIAVTKGKVEKEAKLRKRLAELQQLREGPGLEEEAEGASGTGREITTKDKVDFSLAPNCTQAVVCSFMPPVELSEMPAHRCLVSYIGTLEVYESGNKDFVRSVAFTANVCLDAGLQKEVQALPIVNPQTLGSLGLFRLATGAHANVGEELAKAALVRNWSTDSLASVRSTKGGDKSESDSDHPASRRSSSIRSHRDDSYHSRDSSLKMSVPYAGISPSHSDAEGTDSEREQQQRERQQRQLQCLPLATRPQQIDLGKVVLGTSHHRPLRSGFELLNNSPTHSVSVVILSPGNGGGNRVAGGAAFRFWPDRCTLAPMSTRHVNFTCRLSNLGLQTHQIRIEDASQPSRGLLLPVVVRAKPPAYLDFLDLSKDGDFVIGNVYVRDVAGQQPPPGQRKDPRTLFAKVVPFRLANVRSEPLALSVSSNLRTQVQVYADERLTQCLTAPVSVAAATGAASQSPAKLFPKGKRGSSSSSSGLAQSTPLPILSRSSSTGSKRGKGQSSLAKTNPIAQQEPPLPKRQVLIVPPHSTVTVFVAVRPHLAVDNQATGKCRHLVAGLRFEARLTEASPVSKPAAKITIRMKGVVGKSLLAAWLLKPPDVVEVASGLDAAALPRSKLHHLDLPVATKPLHQFKGALALRNCTEQLPLRYAVHTSSDRVVLEAQEGVLGGRRAAGSMGLASSSQPFDSSVSSGGNSSSSSIIGGGTPTKPNGDTSLVRFSVQANAFGLFRERITVINRDAQGPTNSNTCDPLALPQKDSCVITLRLFVADGRLETPELTSSGATPYPQLQLGDVQVSPHHEQQQQQQQQQQRAPKLPLDSAQGSARSLLMGVGLRGSSGGAQANASNENVPSVLSTLLAETRQLQDQQQQHEKEMEGRATTFEPLSPGSPPSSRNSSRTVSRKGSHSRKARSGLMIRTPSRASSGGSGGEGSVQSGRSASPGANSPTQSLLLGSSRRHATDGRKSGTGRPHTSGHPRSRPRTMDAVDLQEVRRALWVDMNGKDGVGTKQTQQQQERSDYDSFTPFGLAHDAPREWLGQHQAAPATALRLLGQGDGDVDRTSTVYRSAPVQRTFVLRNTSQHTLRLCPRSALQVKVTWSRFQQDKQSHSSGEIGSGAELDDAFVPVGAEAHLPPGEDVRVNVLLVHEGSLSAQSVATLERGDKVPFNGLLVFAVRAIRTGRGGEEEGEETERVSACVSVSGSYCLSRSRLDLEAETTPEAIANDGDNQRVVNVGRVGYDTRWQSKLLHASLRNLARVPLFYRVDVSTESAGKGSPVFQGGRLRVNSVSTGGSPSPVPSSFGQIGSDGMNRGAASPLLAINAADALVKARPVPVAPLGARSLGLELLPARLPLGRFRLHVAVVNLRNSLDTHRFVIVGEVAECALAFSRLIETRPPQQVGHNDISVVEPRRELVLPALVVPTPRDAAPTGGWFTVQNTSDRTLELSLRAEQAPELQELLTVQVLSRASNTPVEELALRAGESADLLVRVSGRNGRAAGVLPARMHGKRLAVGTLWVHSPSLPREEPVHLMATLKRGCSVALSRDTIRFSGRIEGTTPGREFEDSFLVRNEGDLDLHYCVFATVKGALSAESPPPIVANDLAALASAGLKGLKVSPAWGSVSAGEAALVRVSVDRLQASLANTHLKLRVVELERPWEPDQAPPQTLPLGATEEAEGEPEQGHTQAVSVHVLPDALCTEEELELELQPRDQDVLKQKQPGLLRPAEEAQGVHPTQLKKAEVASFASVVNGTSQPLPSNGSSGSSSTTTTNSSRSERQQVVSSAPLPKLAVRGCRRAQFGSDRYVLNLGRQSLSVGGTLRKELTVENVTSAPCEYTVWVMQPLDEPAGVQKHAGAINRPEGHAMGGNGTSVDREDGDGEERSDWVSVDRHGGTLQALHSTQQIGLVLSTARLGLFSTYILIGNSGNPSNLKTVRVEMQVVADSGASTPGFQVQLDHGLVSSKRSSNSGDSSRKGTDTHTQLEAMASSDEASQSEAQRLLLDLGDLYFDRLYKNRSFVITNTSPVTLDFTITSDLNPYSRTELFFSLSLATLKPFHQLKIAPGRNVRLYLHIRPQLEPEERAGGAVDSAQTSALAALAKRGTPKEIGITIDCKLIRDRVRRLKLRAMCHEPQMRLSRAELWFRGERTLVDKDDSLEKGSSTASLAVEPEMRSITVANLHRHALHYIVCNPTQFFTVECPPPCANASQRGRLQLAGRPGVVSSSIEGQESVKGGGAGKSHQLVVRPNLEVMAQCWQQFLLHQYVEEHITVYNTNNLTEKYVVTLRLATRRLRHFYADPGPKSGFVFDRLEALVAAFLRDFQAYFDPLGEVLESQHNNKARSSGEARLPAEQSQHEQEQPQKKQKQLVTDVKGVAALLMQLSEDTAYARLYFDFHYLTDELVLYGLKGYVGHFVFQLASLMFGRALRHAVFLQLLALSAQLPRDLLRSATRGAARRQSANEPNGPSRETRFVGGTRLGPFLSEWGQQLGYFISHFPAQQRGLQVLRKLHASVHRRSSARRRKAIIET